MAIDSLSLNEIAAILDISKSLASRLRAGKYEKNPALSERFQNLCEVLERVKAADFTQSICNACPRESCAGCRIAEI